MLLRERTFGIALENARENSSNGEQPGANFNNDPTPRSPCAWRRSTEKPLTVAHQCKKSLPWKQRVAAIGCLNICRNAGGPCVADLQDATITVSPCTELAQNLSGYLQKLDLPNLNNFQWHHDVCLLAWHLNWFWGCWISSPLHPACDDVTSSSPQPLCLWVARPPLMTSRVPDAWWIFSWNWQCTVHNVPKHLAHSFMLTSNLSPWCQGPVPEIPT